MADNREVQAWLGLHIFQGNLLLRQAVLLGKVVHGLHRLSWALFF